MMPSRGVLLLSLLLAAGPAGAEVCGPGACWNGKVDRSSGGHDDSSPKWSTGSASSRAPWGSSTKKSIEMTKTQCGDKPLCYAIVGSMYVTMGLVVDVPYYAIRGVGTGLYYGGKGAASGLAYVGRGIGRGLAYPFNRPPKPAVAPATWEQYKHDVLKHQKRLTKADKANKPNQDWCVNHIPLAVSPNRAGWEARCNGGGAVSRAALPPEVIAAPPEPVVTALPAAVPVSAATPATAKPAALSADPDPAAVLEAVPAAVAGSQAQAAAVEPAAQVPTEPSGAVAAPPAAPQTAGPAATTSPAAAPQEGGPLNSPLTPFSQSHQAAPSPAGSAAQTKALGPAPAVPAAWGSPQDVGALLAPSQNSAAPDAFTYIGRGAAFVRERGLALGQAALKKGAKEVISGGYAPAEVLVNMYDLPPLIGPKIVRAANGDLPVEEADLMTFEAVNVLYNFGSAPNAVLKKMIEKKDAMKGLIAWGVDKTVDASVAGIAALGAQIYADRTTPTHVSPDGTTGEVAKLINQSRAGVAKDEFVRVSLEAKKWLKEGMDANAAIRWDKPSGGKP